jgi:hypothetical protein
MMRDNGLLSLQANIICLLLALIGSTAIIRHPEWFGGLPDAAQINALPDGLSQVNRVETGAVVPAGNTH